ncbi:MAG TPA: PDZ domain-containing protein [Candidatus Acidoferrales bacterium]|nr:PDZ domain-containing protein [Candidatus Acidoferrales bacterium]
MSRMVGRRACRQGTLLLVAILAALPARATIHYAVSVGQPEQHLFRVTMIIPQVHDQIIVQLPVWNGLYQIRDFAYHVRNVSASDEASRLLPVRKLDKQTWQILGQGTITVLYSSYWDEPGPFNSQLNATHAFINLGTVLFYVPERRGDDVRIVFDDLPGAWRVAVALPPAEMAPRRRTRAYTARNYDALVDAPVELGAFEEFNVEGAGARVRVVVHGEGWKREQLADCVRRVVRYETQLLGEAPFEEYLFLYHFGSPAAGAAGGMEHANSTAIFVESGASFANVTAHEFFHLWNVKRIRPQSLEPVDYTHEQWTRALWFAEGVTNTYASFALVRAGLWDRKAFYDDLAAQITQLESRSARHWKSVEEASLDAWLEKYTLYNRPEFSISYYTKGQILGVLLDILIRDATDNRASLDDVLRTLNENFARRGRPYRDTADIRAAAEGLAGRSLEEFFTRYVAGTEELPCVELLAHAGLLLKPRGHSQVEFGFWPGRGTDGVSRAVHVEPGSVAQRAGVREGDVLLRLNGAPFPARLERWLRGHRAGETVRLRLRRDSEEREVWFVLGERQQRFYVIEEAGSATEKQRRIREGLLRGTTDAPRP